MATGLRPFTGPALIVTLLSGLAAIIAGSRREARRPSGPPRHGGSSVWAVLFLALIVWELAAFTGLPRADHPTLSSLANTALDSHPVRTMAFLLWLVGGAALARR
jgi:hypothetical protein